jgi:hypothetical protein
MTFYTTSLVMQSLSTMNIHTDQLWDALIGNFMTLYQKNFDDYAFTYSLWSIAKYA